ncbi:MAG: hypothetical protein V4594_00655 [Bacteroidota bacterium]
MKLENESGFAPLSAAEIERTETILYPKAQKTILWMSAALMGLSFALPFVQGKRTPALIEQMEYPKAFLIFFFVFACFIGYSYKISVYNLRTDLRNGQKSVFRPNISRKSWIGNEQFELHLENLPKAFLKKKFIYPAAESHCFHDGDVVVMEYLESSSVLLKVYAEV